ncbi:MAG: integrase [Bacteroidetes bacterium]|nr:MAG: integrase [Bacteroidota bacterium]
MRIAAFFDYLTYERRFSEHSIAAYRNDLLQYFDYLQQAYELDDPARADSDMVRSWVVHLLQQDYAARSVQRKLTVVKGYYRFLCRQGVLQRNPAAGLHAPRHRRRVPHVLRRELIERLFDELPFADDFGGWRDRSLLELLYGAGLRRAEVIGLRVSDVDFNGQLLSVRGKGNKVRLLPLLPRLIRVLERYLDVRHATFGAAPDALLLTDKGQPMYPMFVYRKVKHYLDLLEQGGPHSPHVLRHTFATHLSEQGADINAVKELLGHASLAATQHYLHPGLAHLRQVYEQAHPRAERTPKDPPPGES